MTRFAGFIAQGEVLPSQRKLLNSSSSTISPIIEWDKDGRRVGEARMMGCPGSVLRVSLRGRIDNAGELACELVKRNHVLRPGGDTEVIAHAYEEWGEACIERLWGMFALAIWDERAGVLLLARDRVGARSLYYCAVSERFMFSSHLATLRELAAVPWEADPKAIDCYLSLRVVPAPLSIYRGVSKLPAAHILKLQGGTARLRRYWSVDFHHKQHIDEGQAVHQFYGLLRDAIQRIADHESIGVLLSAGPDSGMILALLSELRPGAARTFSFASTDGFNELEGARRTAEYFRAENHELNVEPRVGAVLPRVVRQYDEPHGNVSALSWYYVSRWLREHVRIVLSGDGADELFGGHDRHLVVGQAERLYRFPGRRVMAAAAALLSAAGFSEPLQKFLRSAGLPPLGRHLYWMSCFSSVAKASLYSQDFVKRVEGDQARQLLAQVLPVSAHPLDQSLAVDLGLSVPEVLLTTLGTEDIELRTPFLDHRIVELAASLPPSWKVGWLTSKRFLRKAYAPRLPSWLQRSRRKGGLKLPVSPLFRGELRPWIEDYVLSATAIQRGYFEPATIRRLVAEHVQGKADHGAQLWGLLMLELWHRQWFDR